MNWLDWNFAGSDAVIRYLLISESERYMVDAAISHSVSDIADLC